MWNERASNIATDEILEEPMDFYNRTHFPFALVSSKSCSSAFECPISFKP
ncbi:hypothetical protein Syun_006229 [Stephania yunnanensis]|uniref:Uncharacterized protein n=1 Tax=Stephania yunnanensis TaxID=152371 RepID=A0AAP0KXM7_9MAGN